MSAVPSSMPIEANLQHQAAHWTDLATQFAITDLESYETAVGHLRAIKSLQAEADATFDPIIKKAHETHRESLDQKKRVTGPLLQAEVWLKQKMSVFIARQEREREEERRRLREEQARLALEAREAEIEEAETEGASPEELKAIVNAPLRIAPSMAMPPAVPRVQGIAMRDMWQAEVTNFPTLVKFVAANLQYINLLQPNESAIGGMARSLRSSMSIPGIRVSNPTNIAVRKASS